ncbi:rhomboid family intramembrane serine protease [Amnibacterium sp.]|uniref:rhomboid family intramembrane serine protease n=1 Tax=Amnibacterium sp. TaxID=1872496 RepID=UPI0026336BA9|nr:rhomboid family intramembrane serine protease [Amnibacterium sp.]MCU1472605.1 rhomboid family intrarane serine protease [Amnibacterium sp.]
MTTERTDLEVDPSVCYRHRDRHSWTLCARCGRTICPECQIPGPGGVRCAPCVAEEGGRVTWQPVGGPGPKPVRRRPTRSVRLPSWLTTDDAPVSRIVLVVSVLLWVAGFFTGNLPFGLLAAAPGSGTGWQLWRFVTAPLVSPAAFDGLTIVAFLLQAVFWVLSAPQAERMLGRRRFAELLVAATVVGTAAAVLAGQYAYGLFGPLFGSFAAVLVLVWHEASVRNRFLVMIGVNLLLILVLSRGIGLPCVIGAMIAGAGLTALHARAAERPLRRPWSPQLIVGAGSAVLVLLAAFAAG